ncbi:MAG: type II toxin-antitoxin system RelE/ParE family toxin [Chromatiales bacterium]
MKWNVRLAKHAAKQLEKAPRDYYELLLKKLRETADDPFRGDVVQLKGKEWKGYYRKRAGRYRIIFLPHQSDHTVDVISILTRDEKTYR